MRTSHFLLFLCARAQLVSVFFRKFGGSCYAGSDGCFGNGFRYSERNLRIEYVDDDMIRIEFAAMDSEVCESMSSSEFHFLIDLAGTYIESAAEEAWEYGGVVDLVRHIASAGAIDVNAFFFGFFVHDFRYRVCHSEDNALVVHGLDGFYVEYARCRAADEDVSAFDSVSKGALFVFRIDFGDEFLLYAVSLAIVKEDAFGVQDGHVFRFYAVFEEQTGDRGASSTSAGSKSRTARVTARASSKSLQAILYKAPWGFTCCKRAPFARQKPASAPI